MCVFVVISGSSTSISSLTMGHFLMFDSISTAYPTIQSLPTSTSKIVSTSFESLSKLLACSPLDGLRTFFDFDFDFDFSKLAPRCDITAHTVLLYVLFCLIYMYCTLYVLYILHTVHIVHVPCFIFNICSPHLFTLYHVFTYKCSLSVIHFC